MRGQRFKNVMAENVLAISAKSSNERWMNKQWKMCWKCQKDKSIKDGYLRITAGLHKFICKDCMDAKENKHEPS